MSWYGQEESEPARLNRERREIEAKERQEAVRQAEAARDPYRSMIRAGPKYGGLGFGHRGSSFRK